MFWQQAQLTKRDISTVQINLGNLCNMRCRHCHVDASPKGQNVMVKKTAESVLNKLIELHPKVVEFTGGAPEMNPNLPFLIDTLSNYPIRLIVRSNLTVLLEEPYSKYIDLFSQKGVELIGSLPSCIKDASDRQRGRGSFDRTIEAIKVLNQRGYGKGNLPLDLVYNPEGDYLPSQTGQLEEVYRRTLRENYGVHFDRLIGITNVPIGRFRRWLQKNGRLEDYMRLLVNNFNYETLQRLMCLDLISIDYAGYVYDCDFNLAIGKRIKGYEQSRFWEIDLSDFHPEVNCDEHCYACTACAGSSCQGALIDQKGIKESVKDYYGNVLEGTKDLKTSACCTTDAYAPHIKEALKYIADEVNQKYYGCGSPIPLALKGLKVLDLGCGSGRDCYILSKLVGPEGMVYGIDMTDQQIEVAKRYISYHTEIFGYHKPNVVFIQDYLENLSRHFNPQSLDLVVSNCVVNLVEDKASLLKQVYDVLKEGGEFYFADIYADRRLTEGIRKDPVLYGECLGGALYYRDFERLARKVGFVDCRVMSRRRIDISNQDIASKIGATRFYSVTYRLFKINRLEDACEDYGHIAIYKGGIPESPHEFRLDDHHTFEIGKPMPVCGNTALMLSKTRFRDYFEVIGSFEVHYGAFGLGDKEDKAAKNSCC